MNLVCKFFIVLSFLGVSSFAMDKEEFGLRKRKNKEEKPIIAGNSSSSNEVRCMFQEMPEELVILIFERSDFIGKCSAITSCQKFYKMFENKKPFDISWASNKINQWKILPSKALPIIMDAELEQFNDVQVGQVLAYCHKIPCGHVNTTRDCDRYNKTEAQKIKYAYIVLKLAKLKNNFSPEKCQKAQEILKGTSEPVVQAIPGLPGFGLGLLGSFFIGRVAYNCFGGVGAIVCFTVSLPVIAGPLLFMEYLYGNYGENFCAEDVKGLSMELDAESDDSDV